MIYARLRLFIFSSCSLCFPPLFDLPCRSTSDARHFIVFFHISSRRWGKASRGREVLNAGERTWANRNTELLLQCKGGMMSIFSGATGYRKDDINGCLTSCRSEHQQNYRHCFIACVNNQGDADCNESTYLVLHSFPNTILLHRYSFHIHNAHYNIVLQL